MIALSVPPLGLHVSPEHTCTHKQVATKCGGRRSFTHWIFPGPQNHLGNAPNTAGQGSTHLIGMSTSRDRLTDT